MNWASRLSVLCGLFFLLTMVYIAQMLNEPPIFLVDMPAHMLRVMYMDSGIPSFTHLLVPVWYFIHLAFYQVIPSILHSTYLSILAVYLIGIRLIIKWSEWEDTSPTALFLTIGNPLIVSWLLLFGRIPELFAWVAFTALFMVITRYWGKPLDRGFIWFIPALVMVGVSHYSTILLSAFILIPFFKNQVGDWGSFNHKSYLIIICFGCVAVLLTSVYYFGLASNYVVDVIADDKVNTAMSLMEDGWLFRKLVAFLCPLFYLTTISFTGLNRKLYWMSDILALILMTRLIAYTPILNRIHPTIYGIYFLFLAFYLYAHHKKFNKLYALVCIGLLVAGVYHTIPLRFGVTPEEQEVIDQMPDLMEEHPLRLHWYMQVKHGIGGCTPWWPKSTQFLNPKPTLDGWEC